MSDDAASSLLDDSLSELELADQVRKSREQVARWRRQRIGPPHFWLGKTPRYPRDSTRAWLAAGGTAPRRRGRK